MLGDELIIETLKNSILGYGTDHPERVHRYACGERVIQQGAISDVCFLVKTGILSILVKDGKTGSEVEVALRYARDFVGETAFLQRGVPRTASVVVSSPDAELISINRPDLYEILRQEPNLHDTIASLWELSASRRRDTSAILGGKISVRTKMMSAVLGDIHNFSSLGEVVWEEELDAFLFDFIDLSDDLASRSDGVFEDQGDGFKIVFGDGDHASRAVRCALEIVEAFRQLRAAKIVTSAPFRKIGIGIGVCTDFMSIRRRDDSLRRRDRILSHALNVAAAISKYREAVDETEVYTDETTVKLVQEPSIAFKIAEEIPLEKLGRRQTVYRAFRLKGGEPSPTAAALLETTRACMVFVSYSHADAEFVDRLVQRLELDGITIWRDSTEVLVGDDIDRAISEGIQANQLFLVVLTPNSVKSNWVSREFDEASHEAVSGKKVLLPVLTGGLTANDVPRRIRRKRTITFDGDFEGPYAVLLRSIREHTRRFGASRPKAPTAL